MLGKELLHLKCSKLGQILHADKTGFGHNCHQLLEGFIQWNLEISIGQIQFKEGLSTC